MSFVKNVVQIAFNILKGIQWISAKWKGISTGGAWGTWLWHQNWPHGLGPHVSARPQGLLSGSPNTRAVGVDTPALPLDPGLTKLSNHRDLPFPYK